MGMVFSMFSYILGTYRLQKFQHDPTTARLATRNTASELRPHTQTDRGKCPIVGL